MCVSCYSRFHSVSGVRTGMLGGWRVGQLLCQGLRWGAQQHGGENQPGSASEPLTRSWLSGSSRKKQILCELCAFPAHLLFFLYVPLLPPGVHELRRQHRGDGLLRGVRGVPVLDVHRGAPEGEVHPRPHHTAEGGDVSRWGICVLHPSWSLLFLRRNTPSVFWLLFFFLLTG